MKKLAILLAVLMFLSACGVEGAGQSGQAPETAQAAETAEAPETADAGTEQPPVLVVYFSRVGNTDFPADVDAVASASVVSDGDTIRGNAQLLAEWMADEAGCETREITTEEKYPIDYDETTDVAKAEQNRDARPALSGQIEGLDGAETVFLVYPNWWGDLPMALYAFFDEYDFSGKALCVTVTHGGSGFSGGISTIQSLEPGAQVIEGLSIRDGAVPDSEEEVRELVRQTLG